MPTVVPVISAATLKPQSKEPDPGDTRHYHRYKAKQAPSDLWRVLKQRRERKGSELGLIRNIGSVRSYFELSLIQIFPVKEEHNLKTAGLAEKLTRGG